MKMPERETYASTFPTTRWTLVELVQRSDGELRKSVLADLLRAYLPALRCHLVFVRRFDSHTADDLLQSFVTEKILAKGIIGHAIRSRGRFRNFLLVSLNRFVANHYRDARRLKRYGGNVGPPEQFLALQDTLPVVEDAFEISWAKQVLVQAIERMRAECNCSGRPDVWGVFEERIWKPAQHGVQPMAYELLVARYGFVSPTQASNVLTTASRMYRRCLRSIVANYTRNESEIDDEIADLQRILSRGRAVGRLNRGK